MTVFEPGPGMGFFTLELARRVGDTGRVVAVDVQPRMIAGLKRRATRERLLDRIDTRVVASESMGLTDLTGKADFTLAFGA
jgi:ubiquinone/menaquinone biosynthesis C-methylase UbiE